MHVIQCDICEKQIQQYGDRVAEEQLGIHGRLSVWEHGDKSNKCADFELCDDCVKKILNLLDE